MLQDLGWIKLKEGTDYATASDEDVRAAMNMAVATFGENELTNGGHYMVPFIGGASYRVVFMNKTLCEKLGLDVPAYDAFTWDTLLSYGQKAVEAGYKGYVAPWIGDAHAPMCNYVNFLYQAGGSILDENGDYNLDSPESVKVQHLPDRRYRQLQL